MSENLPGFIGSTNTIAICVQRSGFQPYVYRAVYEETKDLRFDQKLLRVRIRKGARKKCQGCPVTDRWS